MMNVNAVMVMNLVGLILIAALSGGIVAVSLRLRASGSSGRFGLEVERLPEADGQRVTHPRYKIRPAKERIDLTSNPLPD